jgi:hypothetical protein
MASQPSLKTLPNRSPPLRIGTPYQMVAMLR